MSKTVSGATTQFLYDRWNPVQELSASGTPTANLLTGLGIDQRFTRTDASGTSDFLSDALGSTIALADTSGTVQTSYTYEPFGNVTTSGASSTSSYQYTGREVDGTGLDFLRARYYSPTYQRFLSEDPLGYPGGHDPDLYAYAKDSPTNLTDRAGLDPLGCGWSGLFCEVLSYFLNVVSPFISDIAGCVGFAGGGGTAAVIGLAELAVGVAIPFSEAAAFACVAGGALAHYGPIGLQTGT